MYTSKMEKSWKEEPEDRRGRKKMKTKWKRTVGVCQYGEEKKNGQRLMLGWSQKLAMSRNKASGGNAAPHRDTARP